MFKGRHFDRSVILLCVRWYPPASGDHGDRTDDVGYIRCRERTRDFLLPPRSRVSG
jgi:hypothetical protein